MFDQRKKVDAHTNSGIQDCEASEALLGEERAAREWPRTTRMTFSHLSITIERLRRAWQSFQAASHNICLRVRWIGSVAAPFLGARSVKIKCAALLACIVSFNGILVTFTFAQKSMVNALVNKQEEEFYASLRNLVFLFVVAALNVAANAVLQGTLAIGWRRNLTHSILSTYLGSPGVLYAMRSNATKTDNPDQRICADVNRMCDSVVGLSAMLIGRVLSVVSFSVVLYQISPPLVVYCISYVLCMTLVGTVVIGVKLKELAVKRAEKEADVRFTLVRARENAEEITLLRGEKAELFLVNSRLSDAIELMTKEMHWLAASEFFQHMFMWVASALPYLAIAPLFFQGEVDYGVVTQAAQAFAMVQSGFALFVQELPKFASIAAHAERIEQLQHALVVSSPSSGAGVGLLPDCPPNDDSVSLTPLSDGEEATRIVISTPASDSPSLVRVQDLTVMVPGAGEQPDCHHHQQRRKLCDRLSFALRPGESLIMSGPSGCGKSSIVRALAGLFREGSGLVERPGGAATVFLPQKPYMPMVATLRACLLYPGENQPKGGSGSTKDDERAFDDELCALLRKLNLDHILGEGWGLSSTKDWSAVLSLGEQQRLAWIRMLISNPLCVVVDEATSALDEANESLMYDLLVTRCRNFISVGHRPSLFKWHSHVLSFSTNGEWAFQASAEPALHNIRNN
jgi:putative ATP-binding cassette transporter